MSITLNTPFASAPLTGGYTLQVNEFDSNAALVLTSDGNPNFVVSTSSVSVPTNGAPACYSSIYYGTHWGTKSNETALPIPLSQITGGGVALTSWTIDRSTVASGSVYDCSYDIWFDPSPTANQGAGNSVEMMVWLAYSGPSPAGSKVASAQTIAGHVFDVWYGTSGKGTISYVLTTQASSVTNLDIGLLAKDAINRGYLSASDYLIDIEAGFELWINGTGLNSKAFSVSVGSTPTPPAPPVTTVTASLAVSDAAPAHGETITVTYAVADGTTHTVAIKGSVTVNGTNYATSTPVTLKAVDTVTYATPTAPGLTFTPVAGHPEKFTAVVP